MWVVAFSCVIDFMGIGLDRAVHEESTEEAAILTTADA